MVYKNFFLTIVLLVLLNTMNAQEDESVANMNHRFPVLHFGDRLENDTFYTGIDGRFVMSFANDSIVQARFFQVDCFQRYQKIHYHASGDTIFLSNCSQVRIPHSLCRAKDVENVPQTGVPVVVKFFYPKQGVWRKEVQEHLLLHEGIYYMDSVSLLLYIPYEDCQYSNFIIVEHGSYYVRLCKEIDTFYYSSYDYIKIDMGNRYSMCHYAMFNEFPLVIRGDSIFPVDNEKNYQCWIDNGFFFPIMAKCHDKPWEAKDIPYSKIGLEGIKFEF